MYPLHPPSPIINLPLTPSITYYQLTPYTPPHLLSTYPLHPPHLLQQRTPSTLHHILPTYPCPCRVPIVERLAVEHTDRLRKMRDALMSSKSGLSQMEAKVVCQKFFTLPGRRGTIEDDKVEYFKIEHFEHRADSLLSGKGPLAMLEEKEKDGGTSSVDNGLSSRKKTQRRPSTDSRDVGLSKRDRRGSRDASMRSEKEPKLDAFATAMLQSRRQSTALDPMNSSTRGGALSQSRRDSKRGDELSNSRHGPASKESAGRGHKLQPSIHITKNPSGSIIRKAGQLSFSEEDLRKAILEARSANIMRGLLENRVRGPVYDDLVRGCNKAQQWAAMLLMIHPLHPPSCTPSYTPPSNPPSQMPSDTPSVSSSNSPFVCFTPLTHPLPFPLSHRFIHPLTHPLFVPSRCL